MSSTLGTTTGVLVMELWEKKAHLIIFSLCEQSYRQANYRRGRKLKRHHPYTVPYLASELVECLGTGDEEKAKALFLSYNGMKAYSGTDELGSIRLDRNGGE